LAVAESLASLGLLKGSFSPAGIIAKQGIKKSKEISIEMFGYDFTGLVIKLAVFFLVAFVISKIMEGIILARGVFVTITALLGWNIPKSEQIPDSLKSLFADGYQGFKFWDIIKIISILLVVSEYMRYKKSEENIGGSVSPMTSGIFILIVAGLGVVTIPELLKKFKSTNFNIGEFQ